jgi:hypothetical protein
MKIGIIFLPVKYAASSILYACETVKQQQHKFKAKIALSKLKRSELNELI